MKTLSNANSTKSDNPSDSTAQRKQSSDQNGLEVRVEALEKQLADLHAGNQQYLTFENLIAKLTGTIAEPKKIRKVREYTDEERKAIRERFEAGKMAKLKAKQNSGADPIILNIQEPNEKSK